MSFSELTFSSLMQYSDSLVDYSDAFVQLMLYSSGIALVGTTLAFICTYIVARIFEGRSDVENAKPLDTGLLFLLLIGTELVSTSWLIFFTQSWFSWPALPIICFLKVVWYVYAINRSPRGSASQHVQ